MGADRFLRRASRPPLVLPLLAALVAALALPSPARAESCAVYTMGRDGKLVCVQDAAPKPAARPDRPAGSAKPSSPHGQRPPRDAAEAAPGTIDEPIEIKGLRIGMTRAEVIAKYGKPPLRDFTVAGVPGKSKRLDLSFHEDRLDYWIFYFDVGAFDELMEALRSKYPRLRCTERMVPNYLGAPYAQVDCSLSDRTSTLSLRRVAQDINTSALWMSSQRRLEALEQKAKANQRDL